MTWKPGPGAASRMWFCLPVAVMGVAASLVLGFVTQTQEGIRIRAGLETQAARMAKDIENRLADGIRPISILALFLQTETVPVADHFSGLAHKLERLGIPVGRLAWEPRVPGDQREAFEAEARAAGLVDYRIVKLTPDGAFLPADPAPEYFPIRLQATQGNFPSALGYDIASDGRRREIMETARDLGEPVAMRPRIFQAALRQAPTYLMYWPLYRDGMDPGSVGERRQLLSGYATAAVKLDDLLNHALREVALTQATLVFRARNPAPDDVLDFVASYGPQTGLTISLPNQTAPVLFGTIFEHRFTLLHQEWALTVAFPASVSDPQRDARPMLVTGLGLLATMALTGIVFVVGRQAERDRAGRRETEGLMDDLEETNKALTTANDLLSNREKASIGLAHARTRFLASASHDLRQPLHALALFTSALTRRVTDPTAAELVGNIRELGLSMQGMFTSLLDLSRLDTGSVQVRMHRCDLDALTGRLLTEYAPRAETKGLSARKAGRFPPVETDPALLEAVLRNLIDNAIKFTDDGGILIAGRTRCGVLAVEVWDTGPGIPEDQCDRIFAEFERLEATARKPGFGLGLPIVRKLCVLIGASVSVCSRPGHGSRFTVALPPSAPPDNAVAPVPDSISRAVACSTMLLVDDDPTVLAALSLELQDLGHLVHGASSAAEGLRLIEGPTAFDMAILDLRLAGRYDGWALAAAWRARRPNTPVVVMTGSTDAETLRRVHDSGLPALFKPVAPQILHRVIASLLGRA